MQTEILTSYFTYDINTKQITPRKDLQLRFQKLSPKAKIPIRAHSTDAGIDFFSTTSETIPPGSRRVISTGLRTAVPEGWALILKDKSGLAVNNGLHVMAGVIDCFSENTLISTVEGPKTIHEIKINDICFSLNETTGEIEKDFISAIVDTGEQEIIIFETNKGELKVTPGTKIYTKEGIKLASEITESDELIFDSF